MTSIDISFGGKAEEPMEDFCEYCLEEFPPEDLTSDHIIPRNWAQEKTLLRLEEWLLEEAGAELSEEQRRGEWHCYHRSVVSLGGAELSEEQRRGESRKPRWLLLAVYGWSEFVHGDETNQVPACRACNSSKETASPKMSGYWSRSRRSLVLTFLKFASLKTEVFGGSQSERETSKRPITTQSKRLGKAVSEERREKKQKLDALGQALFRRSDDSKLVEQAVVQ